MSPLSSSLTLISNLYPNSVEPNKGIFIQQLANALAQQCSLTVVSPIALHPFSWFKTRKIPNKALINGIVVFYPRYWIIPKIGASLSGFFFALGIFNTMKRLKKAGKADKISVHWVYPDGYGLSIVAQRLKIPFSLHALGCDINDYTRYKIRRMFIIRALKRASIIIVKSDALKDKIMHLGIHSSQIKVIYNGVDSEQFIQKPMGIARFELMKQTGMIFKMNIKYCLFLGNFQIEKGLDDLLQAFYLLKNSSIHLFMMGSGPLLKVIQKQIKTLDLSKQVTLLGNIPHSDIPLYMAAADLLCLSSLREGCPNVVLESLSCGTPVVSTNVGAVPKIITKVSYGQIVPIASPDAFAKAILHNMNLKSSRKEKLDFKWPNWSDNAMCILHSFPFKEE
jgi:glycosyltransferase involved in cell wall biosynthesis